MSRLIAFWSPAGAGASTLLLNTAAALGALSPGVVAADLNLPKPSLALAADLLPHDRPQAACLSRMLPLLEGGRLTPDDLQARILQGPGIVHLLLGRHALVLADLTPALDSVACLPVLEMADRIVLVVGPEIASRFHTRRHVAPVKALGLDRRMIAVLNRAGRTDHRQVGADIDLPVALTVPDLRWMGNFAEAGQIAYLAQPVLPALAGFRTAVERLATQLLQEG